MKISTKGRYAVRMMIDLAEHQGDGVVALKDIAERQGISKKYLEQIVQILNRSDLLTTSRGYRGGYRLARPACEYTVKDILELTEGGFAPTACIESGAVACERCEICATLPMWKGLQQTVEAYLSGITIQDLLELQQSLYANSYVI